MRERLECGLIDTTCTQDWSRSCEGEHADGRLVVRAVLPPLSVAEDAAGTRLAQAGVLLRRYDAGLICITQDNLAWARMSLLRARDILQTPLLVVAQGLRARALNDLCELGLADFLRAPLCPEELRVRLERILDRWRLAGAPQPDACVIREPGGPAGGYMPTDIDPHADPFERVGRELDAYAYRATMRHAADRVPLRVAKGRVIERFETAYIRAALRRQAGNVAQAAQAAQKHRRAFWALMRKYRIDAAPYRGVDVDLNPETGG